MIKSVFNQDKLKKKETEMKWNLLRNSILWWVHQCHFVRLTSKETKKFRKNPKSEVERSKFCFLLRQKWALQVSMIMFLHDFFILFFYLCEKRAFRMISSFGWYLWDSIVNSIQCDNNGISKKSKYLKLLPFATS